MQPVKSMSQSLCKTTSQAKAMEKAIAESSKLRPSTTPSHSDDPSTSKMQRSTQLTPKTSTSKPSEKWKPPPDPILDALQPKQSKHTKSKTPVVPPQQVSEPSDIISVSSPSDDEGIPSHQLVSQSPSYFLA